MNKLDSELIEAALRRRDYVPVADKDDANVVIYNTCSVRDQAENRVLSHLGTYRERAEEESLRFVHPANEAEIIAGVATSGLEVVQELPEVDTVFVPVGSGSYASGYCLTAGVLANAEVVAVQSEGADAAYQAWHSGRLDSIDQVTTFAEGIAVGTPFELTSHILRELLGDFVRVSDNDLREAIRSTLTKEHILAEAAGVASVAGAAACRSRIEGQTVVLPVCGRNLSTEKLRSILAP